MKYEGVVWRFLPASGYPLDFGYMIRASGRWNRKGQYSCLYTSTTKRGCLHEYVKRYGGNLEPGLQSITQKMVSIDVNASEGVLDLTDPQIQSDFEITLEDITKDTDQSLELCRSIADYAVHTGHSGILAPSAAVEDETNLMIYAETAARSLQISKGDEEYTISQDLLDAFL